MAATLTTVNALLKEFYLPGINEQLNNEIPFLAQIEKNIDDVQGNEAVFALHTGRNSGIGARADGGTLPTAGNQGYVQAKAKTKNEYAVLSVTGPTIAAAKSDKGSFLRAIGSETEGATRDLKRDVNRQCWGTSNGVIATCGTTTTSTTVVLAAATTRTQLLQLHDMIGAKIDIASVSGGVYTPVSNGSGVTLLGVTDATPSITIDGSGVSTTSADFIGRTGSMGSGASQEELTGIQTQVAASGTLWGVDPSTYPSWVSTSDLNGGTLRSVSESLIEKQIDNVRDNSGHDVNLMVSDRPTRRAVANLLQSLKRFTNTLELKGGFKALSVAVGDADVPLMTDRDCPSNSIYGFDTDVWREFAMSGWEFMEEDGGGPLIRSTTSDSYTGVLRKYMELVCKNRGANFVLGAITPG